MGARLHRGSSVSVVVILTYVPPSAEIYSKRRAGYDYATFQDLHAKQICVLFIAWFFCFRSKLEKNDFLFFSLKLKTQ